MALGTDSRASNPDLSLWQEVLHLRQSFPDVHSQTLLELATRRGALALGWESEAGTLTPGKSADMSVITLCEDALALAANSSHDALLHPGNRVIATMRRGRRIHR